MTMIIKAGDKNAVKYAVSALKQGGVIVYPTETSYGIGADFTNTKAKKRVYVIKQRTEEKRFSVIVDSIKTLKNYAKINKEALMLAKKFMPGPITVIVKRKPRGTLAFRIPGNKFAFELAKKYKKPITATSANISGQQPLYKIKDVIRTFDSSVDLIIGAGNLPLRKPSTIYCTIKKKVLRKGPISEGEILKVIKHNLSGRIATP